MKTSPFLKCALVASPFFLSQPLLAQESLLGQMTYYFEAEITSSEGGFASANRGIGEPNISDVLSVGNTLSGYLTVDFFRDDSNADSSLGVYASVPDRFPLSLPPYTPYNELEFVDSGLGVPRSSTFTLQPNIPGNNSQTGVTYSSEFEVRDDLATATPGSELEITAGGTYGAQIESAPTLGTPEGDSVSFRASVSRSGRRFSEGSSIELLLSSLDDITLTGDELTPESFDLSAFEDASLLYYNVYSQVNLGSPGYINWRTAEANLTTLTPVPEPSTWLLTFLSASCFLYRRRR